MQATEKDNQIVSQREGVNLHAIIFWTMLCIIGIAILSAGIINLFFLLIKI